MPKFSVIIPLYNKEKDILKTLRSLREQTFSDFEAIVVNDGSTDDGAKLVEDFRDPRIKLFSKRNEGVALTRNFGAEKATSRHLAFLDADDYWYPNHLQNLHTMISAYPDALWYATAYEKQHNKNLITNMISPIMQKKEWIGKVDDYFENSLIDALAWTSAVCMKKDFFRQLRGFDATITNGAGEDTDLWLRAALASPLVFSTTISARHNLDGSNRISHTPTKNRVFMDPDKYEPEAKSNPFLKKYLDLNRFSFALQHKMAGDVKAFEKYVAKIDQENLTRKQRFLLQQSGGILKTLKISKQFLEAFGTRISAFN